MTIPEYLNHLKHPEASEFQDTAILRDLVDRFPYCTSSQILLAYRLFRENDLGFPAQLKKVAAYASSRKKLKQLFDEFKILREKHDEPAMVKDSPEQISPVSEEPAGITDEPVTGLTIKDFEDTTILEIDFHQPEPQSPEKIHEEELLAIVRRRLAEIKIEREKERENIEQATIGESSDTGKSSLTKDELIDKFIHDTPRLSPPRAAFFSPSEKAVKSNTDDEEIVTETLARLYYNQGNIVKATKIYDKLILLFPEKSSYFAAQIEKMTDSLSSSAKEGKD